MKKDAPYSGMIIIHKETGYTSSDVVAKLRGILHMRKIGHTGTLDPGATGVLPVCLGSATKLCELIADRDKEYVAVCRLGVTTDTEDMSGEVLTQISREEVLARITADALSSAKDGGGEAAISSGVQEGGSSVEAFVRKTVSSFEGSYDQVPPMYSAIWVDGKRLYDLARKGITVERTPRRVTIHELELLEIRQEDPVTLTLRVRCSKGTYIRSLCRDIGEALGCGGAMASLVRTRVGQFRIEDALTLDEVSAVMHSEPEKITQYIQPVDSFFPEALSVTVPDDLLKYLENGNPLAAKELGLPDKTRGQLRMYDAAGRFYALYEMKGGRAKPVKMFL
ncbi:MAG: tRNA pseudouridine(55) synthase TruB [Lachnospiraceae bacterium]|nr:tRNA pseudouridine(55) synthase TruB [Lachnospiraceae bacterium]